MDRDYKMIKMRDGKWYKAYYAGDEYGWVDDKGDYLGDDSPSSPASTPVAILTFEDLDELVRKQHEPL